MAIRTKLLSGRNINTDSDFSKYIETVSEPGVIEGLEVSTNSVAVGKCRVPCERTNGETIYSLVENFSALTIDTSGTGYVVVKIGQTYIDDGSLINEDGTGVATIEVVETLPTKNYLQLASISSGTITDTRNIIKKVGELNTAIQSLNADIEDLDERVEALEEAGAIDHLEESALVGENYSLDNILTIQETSEYNNCGIAQNIGDIDANKEIHIQRIGSGVSSNQLSIKLKSSGSPTTGLVVEVRKGVKVDVSDTEAYWYGDEVIASGSIAYGDISGSWSEFIVTLDNNFGGTKGELLDVVVYQTGNIVNASNYYCVGYDSSQVNEAFSLVKVNGTTRTRTKFCSYCISDGFADKLIVKYGQKYEEVLYNVTYSKTWSASEIIDSQEFSGFTRYEFSGQNSSGNSYTNYILMKNGENLLVSTAGTVDTEATDVMKVRVYNAYNSSVYVATTSAKLVGLIGGGGDSIKGKPMDSYSIGETGYMNIFGGNPFFTENSDPIYPGFGQKVVSTSAAGRGTYVQPNFVIPEDGLYNVRIFGNGYVSGAILYFPDGKTMDLGACSNLMPFMLYLKAGTYSVYCYVSYNQSSSGLITIEVYK